jgi:F0F1-type ATP synthase membrane subunit a
LPEGIPLAISIGLIAIEFISYFSRVLSLSIRLFANMMSGHTLLKILISFA